MSLGLPVVIHSHLFNFRLSWIRRSEMDEAYGNIWHFHSKGSWITVTTSGSVRKDGACVMGRGIALEAKKRFPSLPNLIGDRIAQSGNRVHLIPEHRIIAFPVKHRFHEPADLELIEENARELARCFPEPLGTLFSPSDLIYLVRPGCGNGLLAWGDVRPVLERHLGDRFVVVERRAA